MDEAIHRTIKDLTPEERPRERLLRNGAGSLTSSELLAILLGSGTGSMSVIEVARQVLEKFDNDLVKLGNTSVAELRKCKGIGEARAITILAALEFGRRRGMTERKSNRITNHRDIYNIFVDDLATLDHEEFWFVGMNPNGRNLGTRRISQGGIASTQVDMKVLFRAALELGATCIAVVHNHPSGACKPSESDMRLTRHISDACRTVDIQLLDHIIIGGYGDNYLSFARENML